MLRRLLAEGVRPAWVLIEVWPPFLAQAGAFEEAEAILRCDWDWADVPLLARFYSQGRSAINSVLGKRLAPAVHYRQKLLNHYAPVLLPPDLVRELERASRQWCGQDEWGAQRLIEDRPDPQRRRHNLEVGRYLMNPVLENFHVSDLADGALRGLLDECHGRGIRTALFVMPEHSALRGWYPSDLKAAFHQYLTQLHEDYAVPVIDARSWCPDDDFGDMCHLLASGAVAFSERFGRDVCRPLLEGEPLPEAVLFREDAPFTSATPPKADKR